MRLLFVSLLILVSGAFAHAGDTHEFAVIDTCYHWLEKDQLDAKIEYARTHNGAFYFYDASPTYCWRSPLGSYHAWEDHGSYLIRVKFKPGTHIMNHAREDSNYAAMLSPVYYSNDNAWQEYTFRPEAVESWSIYRPETSIEIKAELRYYAAGLTTANDVFYPFTSFDAADETTAAAIALQQNDQGTRDGLSHIYGDHPERHFQTSFPQPWAKFLVRGANMHVVELPKIKVIDASFGLNLGSKYKGNVLAKVAAYCDGKTECPYSIAVRYMGVNPEPSKDKSFDVSWTCSGSPKVYTHTVPAPTKGKTFALSCPMPAA